MASLRNKACDEVGLRFGFGTLQACDIDMFFTFYRAGICDVNFNKVALYMSHTQQIVVWNRKNNTVDKFPRCPAVADFVTCCHTHRIYAITYETPQRMITFDVDEASDVL